MNFEQLRNNVLTWADQLGLLKRENAKTQLLKIAEELGELSGAVVKQREEDIKDGIGDLLVTIIIFSEQIGYHPVKCLQMAYNEIKDRTGVTVDGAFIKNENN